MQIDVDLITVSLHPTESHQLLELLERQGAKLAAGGQNRLDSIHDKVADSTELARWLRDYVSLDLNTREATDLLEFLSHFGCDDTATSSKTIPAIHRKLQQQFAGLC